ncbi:hypothetical protein V1478_013079 [Vespula squamosa]|uniref:Uncharacterized protein n=1 Tax=Vespula squamosa TaxID=30214 RepID=A0ABD2A9S8_VESSQ
MDESFERGSVTLLTDISYLWPQMHYLPLNVRFRKVNVLRDARSLAFLENEIYRARDKSTYVLTSILESMKNTRRSTLLEHRLCSTSLGCHVENGEKRRRLGKGERRGIAELLAVVLPLPEDLRNCSMYQLHDESRCINYLLADK